MPQNNPYDINSIFAEMEQMLIGSYQRNMAKHADQEVKEGFSWVMWQAQKLKDLEDYKKEANTIVGKYSKISQRLSGKFVNDSYSSGIESANSVLGKIRTTISDSGFDRVNTNKLTAMIEAVHSDLDKASQSVLRLIDDQYRKIIFKTQVMYGTGTLTLPKAIDKAAKDFLEAGINSIQYKNGAKVNVASYAEMVLRASSKKAYLTGEGVRAAEYGVYLTQVTSYGACSNTCLPWQGKVYVNDVYAGGKASDGDYPLLSYAMENGLFHPNCRHTTQPYFEGISDVPKPSQERLEEIKQNYAAEQRQRGIERKIREYKRVAEGSVDPENQAKAQAKVRLWQKAQRDHLEQNPFLTRSYSREKFRG